MKTTEIKRLEVLNKKYQEIRKTFNSDTAIVSATQWLKNRMGKEYYELKKLTKKAELYIDMAKDKGTKPDHYHTVVDYKAEGGSRKRVLGTLAVQGVKLRSFALGR